MEETQGRVNRLWRKAKPKDAVLAFEGWTRRGRREHPASSPRPSTRAYHVHPVAAPTEEERVRRHLWHSSWRNLPGRDALASSIAAGTAGSSSEGFARRDRVEAGVRGDQRARGGDLTGTAPSS